MVTRIAMRPNQIRAGAAAGRLRRSDMALDFIVRNRWRGLGVPPHQPQPAPAE